MQVRSRSTWWLGWVGLGAMAAVWGCGDTGDKEKRSPASGGSSRANGLAGGHDTAEHAGDGGQAGGQPLQSGGIANAAGSGQVSWGAGGFMQNSRSSSMQPGGNGGSAGIAAAAGATATASSSRGGIGGEPAWSGGRAGATSLGGSSEWDAGLPAKSNRLDLLFVIDNSLSMADKQELLVQPVPELVERLINPPCVDAQGKTVERPTDPTASCSAGHRDLVPVNDLHVGVISSSLGVAGKTCNPGNTGTNLEDDRGELIAPLRGAPHNGQGFLAYSSGQLQTQFLADVAAEIRAAGEQGCGYEATEEAWYRFLVDPEPPLSVVVDSTTGMSVPEGVDQTLLNQRAAFLRPDSALIIVVLSDENDCSMVNNGQGWLIAETRRMPRATSACATDPNSPCCRSCKQAENSPPTGCAPLSADAECQNAANLAAQEDAPNLRCWQTKRRFGFDVLYPVQRYIDALSLPTVSNRSRAQVPNPLYSGGRHPSLVTLVGIVGVPWQDLAQDPADTAQLHLLSAGELEAQNRWPMITEDPARNQSPSDPFMQESVDPRSGSNPVTGQLVVSADSTDPQATINGHEFRSDGQTWRDELQYACTYPLATARDCTLPEYNDRNSPRGCDCTTNNANLDRNRPLCQPPAGGPAGTTQYYAKAYPGLRHLAILHALGPRAVVGSICPRNTSDQSRQDYGYAPVVEAIARRLTDVIQ